MEEQTIEMPLTTGDHVALTKGQADPQRPGRIIYEGTVEQYVPETGLLRMSDGTSLAEFRELVEEANGYKVRPE